MDYVTKCHRIANSYYNQGLEKAGIRDLTGAVVCLKKSVHYNKYHIDARNLLGLIYYEMGEVAQAMVQWVISSNFQPSKNRATYYLNEIQGKPGRLEVTSQNVKKYNQALVHAQNGSDDLAVLQLTRVVEVNPQFVKAHLVLALLYMNREDYTKAGRSLYKVLQIDKNNPKAQWYMSIVKANTGKADIEKKKLKNAFSHRQMQDDDIIIPPTYKENTGWQSVLNIIAGLVLGTAAFFFLVMPANTRALNQKHNQELLTISEQLNQKNLEIDSMKEEMASFQDERDAAKESLQSIVDSNGGELSQYQQVIQILKAYKDDNFEQAVRLYADLNPAVITDQGVQAVIGEIRGEMETEGYKVLETLGDTAAAAGDTAGALDYYQKSLNIYPDNPQVIFDMAVIYKNMEDKEKSNELFGQVIMNYSGTELAEKAREERGY